MSRTVIVILIYHRHIPIILLSTVVEVLSAGVKVGMLEAVCSIHIRTYLPLKWTGKQMTVLSISYNLLLRQAVAAVTVVAGREVSGK
jgi:hypothetical protein